MTAEIDGKIVDLECSDPQNIKGGRWIMVGSVPLTDILQSAKTVGVSVVIELDEGTKKESGKRTLDIIDS